MRIDFECSRDTASQLTEAMGLTAFDTDVAGEHGESIIEFSGKAETMITLRELVRGNYLKLEIWEPRP